MRCPKRKEALKKKEEVSKAGPSDYLLLFLRSCCPGCGSLASAGAPDPDPSQTLAGLMRLFHAHLANLSAPGCFQQTLSAGLASNGLPDIKLPPPPPLQHPEAFMRALAVAAPNTAVAVPAAAIATSRAPTVVSTAAPSASASPPADDDASEESDSDNSDQKEPSLESTRFGFFARASSRRKNLRSSIIPRKRGISSLATLAHLDVTMSFLTSLDTI